MICILKWIKEKRSKRLWSLKGRRLWVDGRVIYPSLSTPSFTGVKFRSRGCTVWVGGVTADSQGGGQQHRLSAAREGAGQGDGNLAACNRMQILRMLIEVLSNDLDQLASRYTF